MIPAKYKAATDSELIGLCLEGDSQAWEALFFRYKRLMYSIPVRFGLPISDAADVFQTVCVRLIEHLHELKDERKLSAWVITTTTRLCITARQHKERETTDDDDYEEPLDPTDNIEDIQMQAQKRQDIRDAVNELPAKCRTLLEMLYFDTKTPSYDHIAQQLKIAAAGVGPTRARCLDKLRVVLLRKGIK